jgi:hypothetical protein
VRKAQQFWRTFLAKLVANTKKQPEGSSHPLGKPSQNSMSGAAFDVKMPENARQ